MHTFSVPTFVAVYLALCGSYLRNAQGSVVLNSNSIKNLPGGGISNPSQSVSVSPRASPPVSGVGQPGATGTSSPSTCKADRQCGANEFCNESRGACLPCRKRRKRCGRDAMCCTGNRCSNGVCQPVEMDAVPRGGAGDSPKVGGNAKHGQNVTTESKKRTPSQGHKLPKGTEGETCLRSSDCAEGLCCARHFWSRICKPVLTEGQVCTRHRRKGGQGLEIFQRCDCKPGLTCRVQKGAQGNGQKQHREEQQQQQQQPRQHRDLHTCQRR
ncbi:hypothetical protein ACEWY4_021104 [Coilia grayii]|uniref:Dickkopf N-terminal cysteine-rich domain-containing protein n=1 Tax=Coilia grayii TaxID=363190 RepID=A0ABD1JB77_9TELE